MQARREGKPWGKYVVVVRFRLDAGGWDTILPVFAGG